MNKKIWIYALLGAVVIIGVYLIGSSGVKLGGADILNPMNPIFTNGLRVGSAATQVFNSSAQLVSQINTALASVFSGSATFTGETRITNPVRNGTVTALSGFATSVVTAANVCDSSVLTRTPSANSSTTFPTAGTMFADCLTTNGDSVDLVFRNLGVNAASTTILAASASTTMIGATSTIDGGNEALLKFTRYSGTEMLLFVDEYVAAD